MGDSVRVIGDTAKWYIELKGISFKIFSDMEMVFLIHYQLPIQCEIGTNLLTLLHQDNFTHIFYHIHEWRRRLRMIKTQILDKVLMDWFTKSLLPPISRYVAIVEETTEEKVILHAQHLDMIYS